MGGSKNKKLRKVKNAKKVKEKKKKPRKVKEIDHGIKLRIACKDDFIEIDKYIVKNGKKVKKFKIRFGVPYWAINSKGVIENKNYIMNENTDVDSFYNLLIREQILVLTENER